MKLYLINKLSFNVANKSEVNIKPDCSANSLSAVD